MNRPTKPGFYWGEIDGWTDEFEDITPTWRDRIYGRITVCIRVDNPHCDGLRAWAYKMDYAEPLEVFEKNYNAVWIAEAIMPSRGPA